MEGMKNAKFGDEFLIRSLMLVSREIFNELT